MTVFISYSWDNEKHKSFVRRMATDLRVEYGINVLLDQFELNAGKNLTQFLDNSINIADKVLMILTPNYKLKAEKRNGGVGYEYSIVSQTLFTTQNNDTKFIPILREGSIGESAPSYVNSLIYIPFSENDDYDELLLEVARNIYNEHLNVKPEVGNKPDFKNKERHIAEKRQFKSIEEIILEKIRQFLDAQNYIAGKDTISAWDFNTNKSKNIVFDYNFKFRTKKNEVEGFDNYWDYYYFKTGRKKEIEEVKSLIEEFEKLNFNPLRLTTTLFLVLMDEERSGKMLHRHLTETIYKWRKDRIIVYAKIYILYVNSISQITKEQLELIFET